LVDEGPEVMASGLPDLLRELATNLDLMVWEPEKELMISDAVRDLIYLAGLLEGAADRIRSSQISQHDYAHLVGSLVNLLYKVLGPLVLLVTV